MLFVLGEVPEDMPIVGRTYRSISILLTVNDDESERVFLEVRLWPMSWHAVSAYDLQFLIIVEDADGNTTQIYCRNEAAQYVDPVRPLVMDCVLKASEELVRAVQPDVIHIVTFVQRPPENSLSKYSLITDMLENLGYEIVQTGSDPYDRRFWLLVQETLDA